MDADPALLALLEETHSLSLATLEPDGAPRSTPLYFAPDPQLRLIFLSDAKSRHARNLRRDSRASVSLYPETEGWREIRGLQMKGSVEPVPEQELDAALSRYKARFPFMARWRGLIANSTVYRFCPHWVRLIDNREGFGHKREWTRPA
jgi:uncharacterized protein YhbP (UPF0306 family)